MTPAATWRYRGDVASRAVAAIFGGYLVASTGTALLARLLPMARADAVVLATMLALVIYPCAVMWVFATSSVRRAWLGVGAACALFWLAGSLA
jgi:hypothetical protein